MTVKPSKAVPKALKSKIVRRGEVDTFGIRLSGEDVSEANRRWQEAADRQVAAELNDKLLLLAAFRGVDTSVPMWQQRLCIILAADKYPGFRVVSTAVGRPPEWDLRRYARLLCDVENIKRKISANRTGSVTDSHAVTVLVRRSISSKAGEYLPRRGQSEAALIKTLKNRLAEATDVEKNPVLSLIFTHQDAAERKAMVDQLLPRFASPRKK